MKTENTKKYFWLKLNDDFFDDKIVKYLRRLPEGPTLVIIYLKMQLKSLKTEGFLRYDGILPTCEEELALVLDEQPMLVSGAITALERMGAVERWDNDTLYMAAMQGLIGSETAVAERVRKHREMKKNMELEAGENMAVLQSNAELLHSNVAVTKSNTEKRREEKEKRRAREELEKSREDILSGAVSAPDRKKPPKPEEPAIISLILNDKSEWPVTQSDIDGWAELYPAVDILQELRKMRGWLDANPAKRKTKSGIRRFVNGWLAKEQDKGHPAQPSARPANVPTSGLDRLMAQIQRGDYDE